MTELPQRDRCTCPPDGIDPECPWARGGLGHVKACPETGEPCPCYDGSISQAHCAVARSDKWIAKTARIVAEGKKVAQRQDSADAQWFDLHQLGVKFGLYDALDRLGELERGPTTSYDPASALDRRRKPMTVWPGDNVGGFEIERLVAVEGLEGCINPGCRRRGLHQREDGSWDLGQCAGYHCPLCDAPTSMYGHDCPRQRPSEESDHECPDCKGSGEIRWNPSRINDPQCEESARCGRCGGSGAINEKEGECAC